MRTFYYTFALIMILILSSNVLAQQSSVKPGETISYVVDATWPKKPERYKWAQMAGIAVDKQDQIYIFTRSQPTVQVYKADGTLGSIGDVPKKPPSAEGIEGNASSFFFN